MGKVSSLTLLRGHTKILIANIHGFLKGKVFVFVLFRSYQFYEHWNSHSYSYKKSFNRNYWIPSAVKQRLAGRL